MAEPTSSRQIGLIFIVTGLLIAMLYLPRLDMIPLQNEETRRALVAEQMQQSGQYLLPHINGEIYTAKPPLYNWLLIVSSWQNEAKITTFNARLPALTSCLLLVCGMIWFTRHWWSVKTLLFFGLSLLLAPEVIRKATIAEIDMTLTLLVNAALWSWFALYQRRSSWCWILGGFFIGLAFLCKREAGLLCYFITLAGFLYLQRQLKAFISPASLLGILVILTITALWFIPVFQHLGLDGFWQHTQQQLQARQHHGNWLSYLLSSVAYPFKIWAALLPFSLLVPLLIWPNVRHKLRERYSKRFDFCLFAVLGNLLPFILLGDSNVRYFLPMMPMTLMLCAMLFESVPAVTLPAWMSRLCWLQLPRLLLMGVGVGLLGLTISQLNADNTLLDDSALHLGILIVLILVLLGWYQYRVRVVCFPAIQTQFLIYCTCIGVIFRLFYFAYQQPYEAAKLAQHENVPQLLHQIDNLAQSTGHTVVAAASFSHTFYFYDKAGVIQAIDCTQPVLNPVLWLRLSPKGWDLKSLGQSRTIVWSHPYRRTRFVYLEAVHTLDELTAMNKQICL